MAHRFSPFGIIEQRCQAFGLRTFDSTDKDTTMTTATTCHYNAGQGPQTPAECEFAGLLLEYHRRAGEHAAWALAERMSEAHAEGCYREDHVRAVRDALAALPTRH